MNEDVLDPSAEAAVRELADQLSAILTEAVESAAAHALERIEQELEMRVGQIDSATSRVVDLIGTIGDEIRTRAANALTEGIQADVLPVLAQEGRQAGARHAQQISASFLAVEGTLRGLLGEISSAAERNAADVRDRFENVKADTERGTKRLLERCEVVEQTTRKALGDTSGQLREEVRTAAESLSHIAKKDTAELKHVIATVSTQIGHSHDEKTTQSTRLAGELRDQSQGLAAGLAGSLAIQDTRMRRLFYGQLAIGAVAIITLILVVLRVG